MALAITAGLASAYAPSIADLDAEARSVGNRRDVAERIGEAIFTTFWSAQVSQISANQLGDHLIVGIRIWGVKFHRPMTRDEFVGEIVAITQRTFSVEPSTEEVDVWASVPITVTRGVVVSGDLARPTSRVVFSLTVRRLEGATALRQRLAGGTDGVFWDTEWSRSAFKQPS